MSAVRTLSQFASSRPSITPVHRSLCCFIVCWLAAFFVPIALPAQVIQFGGATPNISVFEGDAGNIGGTITPAFDGTIRIDLVYTIVSGDPVRDIDWTANDTIIVPPGNPTFNLVFDPLTDSLFDGAQEVVQVRIQSVNTGTIGAQNTRNVIIVDAQVPPHLEFLKPTNDFIEEDASITGEMVTLGSGVDSSWTFQVAITGSPADTASFREDWDLQPNLAGVQTITVPAAVTIANADFQILDDLETEPAETFSLQIQNPQFGTIGTNSLFTGTILASDQLPIVVQWPAPTTSLNEDAATVFVDLDISPTPLSGNIQFNVTAANGTAISGSDYQFSPNPRTVSFSAGESGPFQVPVQLLNNGAHEADETFTLTISDPEGCVLGSQTEFTFTIVDDEPDPVVSFTVPSFSTAEDDGTMDLTLRLDTVTGATVSADLFVIDGTATGGSDFVEPIGTVVFPPFSLNQTVPFELIDNLIFENDETVTLGLTNFVNGQGTSTALVTISDDEPTPTVYFDLYSISVDEADATYTIDLVVTPLSEPSFTVFFSTADDTATVDEDYSLIPKQELVHFNSLQASATLPFDIFEDAIVEGSERFFIDISDITGNVLTGSPNRLDVFINDNDFPIVEFASPFFFVDEDNDPVSVLVSITPPIPSTVTLTFDVTDLTTEADDYTVAPSGNITIGPNETGAFITVDGLPDALVEGSEEIELTLTSIEGAVLGTQTSTIVSIQDSDSPVLSFDSATFSFNERDGSGNVTMSFDQATVNDVQFNLSIVELTAFNGIDFTPPSNPINVPIGSTTITLPFTLNDDAIYEEDEQFAIDITGLQGADLGTPPSTTVTLVSDEAPPTVNWDSATYTFTEGEGVVQVFATLDTVSSQFTSIPLDITDIDATFGADYDVYFGPAKFGERGGGKFTMFFFPGETTTIYEFEIFQDTSVEVDEQFQVTMGPGTGFTLGTTTQFVATIVDDEESLVSVTSPTASITENGVSVNVGVTIEPPYPADMLLTYELTEGSATIDSDFSATVPAPYTITIRGGSGSVNIPVNIIDDGIYEEDEDFALNLLSVDAATITAAQSTVVTILEDDAPPTISFTSATASVNEGGPITVNLALTGPTELDAEVSATLVGGSASVGTDFTLALVNPIQFPVGTTTASFTIDTIANTTYNGFRDIQFTLTSPAEATVGAIGATTIEIIDDEPLPNVNFTLASSSMDESETKTEFLEITLDNAATVPVSLFYTVDKSSTATSGLDFSISGKPFASFAPLSTTSSISFSVLEDDLDEFDETFGLVLQAGSNVAVGSNDTHTITIVDNDALPQLAFEEAGTSFSESDGSVLVNLLLDAPSGRSIPYTITFANGTARESDDFTGVAIESAIDPGDTQIGVPFEILEDALFELDEDFSITIDSASNADLTNGPRTTVISILNNDVAPTYSFDATDVTVSERDGTYSATVSFDVPAGTTVEVPFQVIDNTTIQGEDYTVDSPLSNLLTFAPGETSQTIEFTLIDEGVFEGDEQFTIELEDPSPPTSLARGGAILTQVVTLTESLGGPTLTLAASQPTVDEDDATPIIVTATLSVPSTSDVTFDIQEVFNNIEANDYTLLPAGPHTIPAGSRTLTVQFVAVDDAVYEGDESIQLRLANVVNAGVGAPNTADLFIFENEPFPLVELPVPTLTVTEGDITGSNLPVTISGVAEFDFEVFYDTTDGTAEAGVDFDVQPSISGFVTIPAGSTSTNIVIVPLKDAIDEGVEDAIVALSSGEVLGGEGRGGQQSTILVADNDGAPSVAFEFDNYSTFENSVTNTPILIQLSAASSLTVDVDVTGASGTLTIPDDGTFDQPLPVTLTFKPGEIRKTIHFTPVDDVLFENTETLDLALANFSNATAGSPSTTVLTVTDGDFPPLVSLVPSNPSGNENDAGIPFNLELSSVSGLDASGRLIFANSTATAGEDYDGTDILFTIPAGSTAVSVSLPLIDDNIYEGFEDLTVSIVDPVNCFTSSGTMFINIFENENFPTALFETNLADVPEGNTLDINITLSPAATFPLAFDLFMVGGDAIDGEDFTTNPVVPTLVSFAAGETNSILSFSAIDDTIDDDNEFVQFELFDQSGKVNGTRGAGPGPSPLIQVNIVDNDDAPAVFFEQSFIEVDEQSGTGFISVGIYPPAPNDVIFQIADSPGTAAEGSDFIFDQTQLYTVNAGTTRFLVELQTVIDSSPEDDETYFLDIINVSGALLGTPLNAMVTIIDDDSFTPTTFNTAGQPQLAGITRILGNDPQDFLGGRNQALVMGDFNDDGLDDVAIGAFGGDRSGRLNCGEVNIIFGGEYLPFAPSLNLEDATQLVDTPEIPGVMRLLGADSLHELGYSLAKGDINGDGIDDLIVGAWRVAFQGDTFGGRGYVFLGGRDWANTGVFTVGSTIIPDMTITPGSFKEFLGQTIAAGDVNGDGFDDVVLGAPRADFNPANPDSGRVYVVWGSDTVGNVNLQTAPATTALRISNEIGLGLYGNSLAVADFSGDGIDDIAASVPLGGGVSTGLGNVVVIRGGAPLFGASPITFSKFAKTSFVPTDGVIYMTNESDGILGDRIIAANVDNDAEEEIVATLNQGATNAGLAVFQTSQHLSVGSGAFSTFHLIHLGQSLGADEGVFLITNDAGGNLFGRAMAAGSIDGTGRDELFLGIPDGTNAGGIVAGVGRVARIVNSLLVPASGISPFSILRPYAFIEGGTLNENVATGAAANGDLNGDGLGDMIVGIERYDNPTLPDLPGSPPPPNPRDNDSGGAFLIWGNAALTTSTSTAYDQQIARAGTDVTLDFDPEVRASMFLPDSDPAATTIEVTFNRTSVADVGGSPVFQAGPAFTALPGEWNFQGNRLFDAGTQITLKYGPRDVVGFDDTSLTIFVFDSKGGWVPLASVSDPGNNTVTATLNGIGSSFVIAGTPRTDSQTGFMLR